MSALFLEPLGTPDSLSLVSRLFVLCLGLSLAVVAVAPPTDLDDPMAIPDPRDVRAFLINGRKGFAYKKGTWHS
ncbi:MAG: ureidoglycolate lyase, partial [Dehalococcoidia bacterium]